MFPPVPVIVRLCVPVSASGLAAKESMVVIVSFAGGLTGLTEKVGVTPGMAEAERVTGDVKLFRDSTVIVKTLSASIGSVTVLGDAVSVKSGSSGIRGTLSLTSSSCERPSLELSMVIVWLVLTATVGST